MFCVFIYCKSYFRDHLLWDRSGIIVETLGNQQYSVKMDGSGRVSLRNRQFLRKIEPFVRRYVTMDDGIATTQVVVDNHVSDGDEVEATQNENSDDIIGAGEVMTDSVQRRSTRIRHPPERYEAE